MRRYEYSKQNCSLPFILLFTVVVLIVPVITIALFDRKYDEQVNRETQEWLEAIVDTGYMHQPEKVKEAYGAEVTVVSSDNTVNYTTLSGDWAGFTDEMKLDEVRKRIKESRPRLYLTKCDSRWQTLQSYLLPASIRSTVLPDACL